MILIINSQVLNTAIDKIYKKELQNRKFQENDLKFIGNIYKQYCSNQITSSELLEYFPVNDEFKELVLSTIEIRKHRVQQYLLDYNQSAEIPLIKTFDWDVKFVTGDSSLSSYRNTIATLIFNCQKEDKEERHSIEMDLDLVNKMIQNLEDKIEKK